MNWLVSQIKTTDFRVANSKRHLHPSIHCSTLYSSQDMEATMTSINQWMDTEYVYIHTKECYSWSRKWQPTPIFLPGKSHGQRSLVGYSPCGHKGDATEHTHSHHLAHFNRHFWGLPWQSSGWDSMLPMQGTWVQSLMGQIAWPKK